MNLPNITKQDAIFSAYLSSFPSSFRFLLLFSLLLLSQFGDFGSNLKLKCSSSSSSLPAVCKGDFTLDGI